MVGVIVASHGNMAQGVWETSKWFFGDQPQFEALCLSPEDRPEDYTKALEAAVERVDTGDGVIIFCDLLFGSPCNCAARILRDGVDVITGLNLSVILEVLGSREFERPDLNTLVSVGKDGVRNLKEVLATIDD